MDSCNVCGGKDMNLVDGFYYCVECGTQDVNVRETVVEQSKLGDGTFAHTTSKKFTTVIKDGIEMSSEWHKWHVFNFILVGLTDELIALGAKPSIKMKVLWIWTRYVKQFQVKGDLQSSQILNINDDDEVLGEEERNEDNDEDNDDNSDPVSRNRKSTKFKSDKIIRDIKTITQGTILTILYVALNLDRSDIQLSHLFRFIREDRLSLRNCMKYVPKELKVNAVKDWKNFSHYRVEFNPMSIRELSLTSFKILKLGVPLVPDLRKIVGNFVKELCLPSDIKDLVFALMHFMPIDFLNVDARIQKSLVRIPDYEGVCMGYILVALKICFGLDDDYEVRISKKIDKINEEENYLKSYKLGLFSEPCDRLFSYNDWCQHLQFRKHILCKNYLPMSQQFNKESDDYTFMEHLEKRKRREIKLSDDVTMDILNKIKSDEVPQIIPKADFPVTLTPMSTYVDILAQRVQDPDLRLLLCEDFTQYSLKYAIKDFTLASYFPGLDNPIVGVSESGKTFNKKVIGTLTVQQGDMTMVYVRNCQNKNWLRTEPPKVHHVTKIGINENSRDKDSDHGYDSNTENSNLESDITHVTITDESVTKEDKVLEILDDQEVNKSIFDDNFININTEPPNNENFTIKEENADNFFEIETQNNSNMHDSKVGSLDNIDEHHERDVSLQLNPIVFDRDKMIKDLIGQACEKYKISKPKENAVEKQNKRKVNTAEEGTSLSEPKKRRTNNRTKSGEAKRDLNNFISAYYSCLQSNILHQVSEHVKSIIEDVDNTNHLLLDSQNELNELGNQNDINNVDNSHLDVEQNEISLIKDTNECVTEDNQVVADSDQMHRDNVSTEETVEDEFHDDTLLESDPKFDEKIHDIGQLYVKLGDNLGTDNISLLDISNDPEIDKIIKKQIEQFKNDDINTMNGKNGVIADESDNFSDSDDDVPLSIVKETNSYGQEKEERRKETLELLIKEHSNVKEFKYWIRHYKSSCVVKTRDMGKKFDLELNENLPVSFVFVIRECAAIAGRSMFSLYKNMQNIEEILIANS